VCARGINTITEIELNRKQRQKSNRRHKAQNCDGDRLPLKHRQPTSFYYSSYRRAEEEQ
jgi:hypothetical protein